MDIWVKIARVPPTYMKSDPLTGTLVGVLAVSVLLSGYYFYSYVNKTREIRNSQALLQNISARNQAMTALVMDVLKYSETHPAIDPLLEATSLKAKPGAVPGSPTIKPAPPTK